jgi:CBS domain-containing protein
MLVKDVMTERVIHVSPESDLRAIAKFMLDGDVGSIPVVEDDKLIGMVTDRDIVIRGLSGTLEIHTLTAQDIMSQSIKYCYEDQPLRDVLNDMAREQIRRLPVVSREKRLVGIVSLGDIAKASSPSQAGEALGEIAKES